MLAQVPTRRLLPLGEIESDPEMVLKAPHHTRTSRVDEVTAARRPVLRWKADKTDRKAAD